MEKSKNYDFYLPSRDTDDVADINQISENFRKIDTEMAEMLKGKGVDQTYKPDSSNPQSGKAISGALVPYIKTEDNMEWVFDGGDSSSEVNIEFVVDDAPSNSSGNPISNRAITQYIDDRTIDYVFEEGVIDGWYYRKWNNGKCELFCTTTKTLDFTGVSGLTRSDLLSIYLPFEVDNQSISVDCNDLNSWASVGPQGNNNKYIQFVVWRNGAYQSFDYVIHIQVYGTWK
jgi:hypothetical protein